MSKLIDISRNKQLQRKLIQYNESAPPADDSNAQVSLLQYTDSYEEHERSPEDSENMNRGGAPLQQKARHQSNIRVRDMKKKKSKGGLGGPGGSQLNYSSDGGTFPAINRGSERLAPL